MANRISIVGGGHIGALLALALLRKGFEVRVITAISQENLHAGRILSSQCVWDEARAVEKDLAGDPWDEHYKGIGGFVFREVSPDGEYITDTRQPLARNGQSVDQRVKVSYYLDLVKQRGGEILIDRVDADSLREIAEISDLTIVTAGKFTGPLEEVLPIDEEKCIYKAPQRVGAVVYLKGRKQDLSGPSLAAYEEWSIVPGVGDFFSIPAYSKYGHCHICCMEGFIGSDVDQFQGVRDSQEILTRTRHLFEKYLPWERDRWERAELIDERSAICGGFRPQVRKSETKKAGFKGPVLLFGDAHITLEPLTAQGANCHIKNLPGLVADIVSANGNYSDEWVDRTHITYLESNLRQQDVIEAYLNPTENLDILLKKVRADEDFARWWVNAHFNAPILLEPHLVRHSTLTGDR